MTTINAKTKAFKITECGYSKYGKTTHSFGDISSTINNIEIWVKGKNLSETSTYTIPQNSDDAMLRTFCYSIKEKDGTYLLTMWNETNNRDGKIPSLNLSDPVGNAKVTISEVPKGNTPGFASYFWFLPNLNIYTSVLIDGRLNGRSNLEEFMKGFLTRNSRHVVWDPTGKTIVGYRENTTSKPTHYTPLFHSKQYQIPGQIDMIKSRVSEIRKIIRKDTLTVSMQNDKAFWEKLWERMTNNNQGALTSNHHIKFEFNYTPSLDELNNMITCWNSENITSHSKWNDDIGFVFHGETEPHWLSKSIVSEEIKLNEPVRQDEEIYNSEWLISELIKNKTNVLAKVPQNE